MSRVLPILFNTEMVRAILDGRKTVTRRVLKHPFEIHPNGYITKPKGNMRLCPYEPPYQPGDIMYVRETWCSGYDGEAYFYFADKNTEREQKQLIDYNDRRWRPSIHMPKEAARIWLKVTDVRVERLQEITINGCASEGAFWIPKNPDIIIRDSVKRAAIKAFSELWNSTLKKSDLDRYGWDANPYVFVIEFERCEKPECKSCLCQKCDNDVCEWHRCQKNSMDMECYTNDCDYYYNTQEEIDEGFLDGYSE